MPAAVIGGHGRAVRPGLARRRPQPAQQPQQQRRAEDGGDSAGRDRTAGIDELHQLVGQRQQPGGDRGPPDQPVAEAAGAGKAGDGRPGQADEADRPDQRGDGGAQQHRHRDRGEARRRRRQAEAARAVLVEVEQRQRPQHQRAGQRGQGQARRQGQRHVPVVLVQRPALRHEQVGQGLMVEQHQHLAAGVEIEGDDQPGQDHGDRRQPVAPAQQQDQGHRRGAAEQGHGLLPDIEQRRRRQGGGDQRQPGAGEHAQRPGLGQRIAQRLLEQHAGEAQRGAAEQSHDQARQQAVLRQHLAHVGRVGRGQGLLPFRRRQQRPQMVQEQGQGRGDQQRRQQGRASPLPPAGTKPGQPFAVPCAGRTRASCWAKRAAENSPPFG